MMSDSAPAGEPAPQITPQQEAPPVKTAKIECRHMIRAELPQVIEIEEKCFDAPWGEEDFFEYWGKSNRHILVGMVGDELAGYFVYEVKRDEERNPEHITLVNFAVDPAFQRRGVGTAMMDKLKQIAKTHRCSELTLDVRESNLPAQLFFKKCGFRAEEILHHQYEHSDEDAYVMTCHVPVEEKQNAGTTITPGGYTPHNRMTLYFNEKRMGGSGIAGPDGSGPRL